MNKLISGFMSVTLGAGVLFTSSCWAEPPRETTDWVGDNTFTQGIEGPVVDKDGNLYAVNFQTEGTIGVVTAQDRAKLWVGLPPGSTGNALRFAPGGQMLVADYTGHNILSIDPATKAVSVFAHEPDMHQPNDIAVSASGGIYASDPNWSNGTGQLWYVSPQGKTHLLEDGMGTTNGIELSPDEKKLYVNESVQRVIWAYDLDGDGGVSNKRELYRFSDFGLDGMSVDVEGNLYVARYGAGELAVISPEGELLRTITLAGKHPTNLTFGGADGHQIFITMQKRGAIETFINDIPGRDWTKTRQ